MVMPILPKPAGPHGGANKQLEDRLPASFADLLASVLDFTDPAIVDSTGRRRWNPITRAWA